jgi:hypothetical protein
MARKLYVRATSTAPFIANFEKGGWTVYKDGKAIKMLPSNTRMWDGKKKEWINVK